MALRQLTKTPKLCLVYFYIDKTTCIVETKKLRREDSGEVLSKLAPGKGDKVTLRSNGKLLDAMVIAADGKYTLFSIFFVKNRLIRNVDY